MPERKDENSTFIVETDGVYTVKEAAKYFKCSERTIKRWLDKKIIKGVKTLGVIKFKGQWLLDVMNNKNLSVGKDIEEEE